MLSIPSVVSFLLFPSSSLLTFPFLQTLITRRHPSPPLLSFPPFPLPAKSSFTSFPQTPSPFILPPGNPSLLTGLMSLFPSLSLSLTPLLSLSTPSLSHSLFPSLSHSLFRSLSHSLFHSRFPSLFHSFIPSLSHSLTPPIRSLTPLFLSLSPLSVLHFSLSLSHIRVCACVCT